MKVRKINRFDYEQVMDMMIDFAQSTGIKDLNHETYDRDHARKILLHCEHSGISLVAEHEGQIIGMLLSVADRDLWIPRVVRLRELAWWVREEYRTTTAGARLFQHYTNGAEELLEQGRITGYTISKMYSSPNLDYERRGFRYVESTYMIGE